MNNSFDIPCLKLKCLKLPICKYKIFISCDLLFDYIETYEAKEFNSDIHKKEINKELPNCQTIALPRSSFHMKKVKKTDIKDYKIKYEEEYEGEYDEAWKRVNYLFPDLKGINNDAKENFKHIFNKNIYLKKEIIIWNGK